MSNNYASQQDLLEEISQDRQADLSNDPGRQWRVGVGDNIVATFLTPFLESTALVGYADGVVVAGTVLVPGAPGVADSITFPAPPATGVAVSVSADTEAVNLTIIQKALDAAASVIDRMLCGRYVTPITGPAQALAVLKPICVTIAKCRLFLRRDIADRYTMLYADYKEALSWLRLVATRQLQLPIGTVVTEATTQSSGVIAWSEPPVFDSTDPDSTLWFDEVRGYQ